MSDSHDSEPASQFEPSANEEGAFQRQDSAFRSQLGADFPLEPSRYHLYISRACPWAHGAVLARNLLGLDEITVDVVDPYREDRGWQFSPDKDGCTTDRVNGYEYLEEAYHHVDASYDGRVTVPLLWDKQANTAVNNESIEIMRMLGRLPGTDRDLYPAEHQDSIDALVSNLYERVNNGVYKAGFATSQQAYDTAVHDLFAALEEYNERLADQRFLTDQLTIADLRLFATLVRFDQVYHTHFKCNIRQIRDYPHLSGFLRDIYQLDGVAETVNMDHIKEHYYRTHPGINPHRIVAAGPDIMLDAEHDRETLTGNALGLD